MGRSSKKIDPGKTRLLILLRLVMTSALLTSSTTFGQEPLLSGLRGLKDVSIPLGPDSAAPSVRLSFAEIKSEPIRLGPFSFGLLPRRVIDGVEIRISCGRESWTADLREFLESEPVMAGVSLRNFRLLDENESLILVAKQATIAQMPWRILLWNAQMPGDDTQMLRVANLYLEGPTTGHLISGQQAWKLGSLREPRTDHEKY
jgi:hypothetical protein